MLKVQTIVEKIMEELLGSELIVDGIDRGTMKDFSLHKYPFFVSINGGEVVAGLKTLLVINKRATSIIHQLHKKLKRLLANVTIKYNGESRIVLDVYMRNNFIFLRTNYGEYIVEPSTEFIICS